jgi:hypothetical protein
MRSAHLQDEHTLPVENGADVGRWASADRIERPAMPQEALADH